MGDGALLQHGQPVLTGQTDVGYHDIGLKLEYGPLPLYSVGTGGHELEAEIGPWSRDGDLLADKLLILDKNDRITHCQTPLPEGRRSVMHVPSPGLDSTTKAARSP